MAFGMTTLYTPKLFPVPVTCSSSFYDFLLYLKFALIEQRTYFLFYFFFKKTLLLFVILLDIEFSVHFQPL